MSLLQRVKENQRLIPLFPQNFSSGLHCTQAVEKLTNYKALADLITAIKPWHEILDLRNIDQSASQLRPFCTFLLVQPLLQIRPTGLSCPTCITIRWVGLWWLLKAQVNEEFFKFEIWFYLKNIFYLNRLTRLRLYSNFRGF